MININPENISLDTLPSIPLKHAQSLPPIPALYFCINREEILYVGITANLNQRWKAHHKVVQLLSYNNVHISWLAIALQDISPALEREFIDYWEPLLNDRTHKPSGIVDSRLKSMLPSLICHPEFTGEAAKVLWGLIIFLDFDNFILLPLSKVAQALNLERSSVSRAAKRLEKIGILERGERVGNFYQFRLNPHYCWKGELAILKVMVGEKQTTATKSKKK